MADRYAVEVNQAGTYATEAGEAWWADFHAFNTHNDRITWTGMGPQDGVAVVACDHQAHAEWLRDYMIDEGIHPDRVTIKKTAAAPGRAGEA